MAASAAFQVNSSTPTGAVAVAAGSTVNLALLSTSGVASITWSIVGNHNSSAVNPTITPAGGPVGATASFVMPAGAGQAYLVQCVVNGGVDQNGDADAALTKRHIIGVNNAATRVPFCVGETLEREEVYGWTEVMNDLSASATTGAVTPPADPGDDGKIARASGGDLTYLGGSATGQTLIWNGSAWVAGALNLALAAAVTGLLPTANLAYGAANTVLRTNAGATAAEWAKLTTANLDAAAGIVGTQLSATAAIAASQLASGGAGTVLAGGTPNTWTATPTVTSLAATYIALGADPADAGAIRLSHAMGVYGESNTPGTDRAVLTWGVAAADTVALGDVNVATQVIGSSVSGYVGASARLYLAAGASDQISFGATPATTGYVRLPHGGTIEGRNSADSGNVPIISWGAVTDSISIGPTGSGTTYLRTSNVSYNTGSTVWTLDSARFRFYAGFALHWDTASANPTIIHDTRTTDAAPQNFTLAPQAPFASATGANRVPGSLVVNIAVPTNSGTTEGYLAVKRGGVFVAQLGVVPAATSYSALYLGNLTPSGTNYTLAYDGSANLLVSTPGTSLYLNVAGALNLRLQSGGLRWQESIVSPVFGHETKTTDTATQNLTLRAQSAYTSASTNKDGGHLLLQGGAEKGSAAGKKGGVRIQLNGTTETMVEATEVAIGRRVVALCRGSDLTTTQMPANTGDGVIYIANAATAPTATPVSGGIMYASSGDIYWRDDAGISSQLN